MSTPAYPDSPYGVAILLDFFSGPPQYHIQQSIINQCAALPVSWVKLIFSWNRVELSPGVYTWPAELDSAIQRFNTASINVQYDFTNPPSWHRTQAWGTKGGTTYYYAPGADVSAFAQAVATRYKTGSANGVISAIQFSNEDYDASGEVGGSNNESLLNGGWNADALVQGYAAIKAIDNNMLVCCGAHLRPGVQAVLGWQAQLNNGGGVGGNIGSGNYRDCSAGDFYIGNLKDPDTQYNTNVCTCAEFLANIHNQDISDGLPGMDLRFTEVGWAANTNGTNGNVTYAVQAANVGKVLVDAMANGACSHIFIYTMDYADKNSLVLSSTVVTQAYTTYQNFIAANPQWSSSQLGVNPIALAYQVGHGGNPSSQGVQLTNNSTQNLSYSNTVTYGAGATNWLTMTPNSGTINASQTLNVSVAVSSSTLAVGTYTATINWALGSFAGTTTVTLTVTNTSSILTASPSTVQDIGVSGQVGQEATTVILSFTGGGAWNSSIQYGPGASGWLNLVPPSGIFGIVEGAQLTHSQSTCYVNFANLAKGNYYAIVTWNASGNIATTVFNLVVNPSPLQPPPGGDANNAAGITRFGYNEVSQGIPLGGSGQKILSMSTKPQPSLWNTLVADIERLYEYLKEQIRGY